MHISGTDLHIQHISHNMTNYLIYKYAGTGTFRGLLRSHASAPLPLRDFLTVIVLGMLSLAPCGAIASPLDLAHVAN